MSFGRVTVADCLNTAPPSDVRCADPAYALAHPDKCPVAPQLIVKPERVLACSLGSVQFKAFYIVNGVETDVTDSTVFQTSDANIAVVGAASGNATGLGVGVATISAAYQDKSAFAEMTVLGDDCCDDETVAMMVVVDNTRSMGQAFGSSYATKLAFAKAAATRFISEVNQTKDLIGLESFDASIQTVLSAPVADKAAVQALVPGIPQTQQLTTFYNGLSAAIDALNGVSSDLKVIILVSDGEDTDTSYDDSANPIALLADFKAAGGIVMCLGVRAHGFGYNLLSAFATGGFFINAHEDVAAASLDYISGLKGYICAGNCKPAGDTFEPSGSLNFCEFTNWNVLDGHVDLLGNGFLDLLPGNGLYVDLAGSIAGFKGAMVSKNTYGIEAGKNYRLKLELSGNQRVNSAPNSVRAKVFARNTDGVPNPAINPSATLTGSDVSVPQELYEYAVTYLNANGETELSTAIQQDNGEYADCVILLTSDPTDTASICRFWKRELGTSKWFLIGESDAAAPAFSDSYNNATLAAAVADGTIDACVQPSDANTTGTPIVFLDQTVAIDSFQQDFQFYNLSFNATQDADVYISIQQVDTPAGYDSIGLLLNSVVFEDATDSTVLFDENFDGENVTYIPPACGTGTGYVIVGNTEVVSLIPAMTSNTEPSGSCTAGVHLYLDGAILDYYPVDGSGGNYWFGECPGGVIIDGNQWWQYQFPAAKTATSYQLASYFIQPPDIPPPGQQNAPSAWVLAGSNNGTDWTEVDSRSGINLVNNVVTTFTIASPGSYLYYRITFSAVAFPDGDRFSLFQYQLFSGGVTSVYGTFTGYDCFGEGCLTEPPAVQAQDPEPLSDIEGGFTPPQEFTSTQTVCKNCATGFLNLGPDLVPVMTSNTAPSGVASAISGSGGFEAFHAFDDSAVPWVADDDTLPAWLQYRFAVAKTVLAYSIKSYKASASPKSFQLQGSNNGTVWDTLDSREDILWSAIQEKAWLVTAPGSYLYYRLNITELNPVLVTQLDVPNFTELQLFAVPGQVCASATATSEVSQSDANNKATTAATDAANAQLNCVARYDATESYTAHCATTGCYGPDVTRSTSYTSLISQQDANDNVSGTAQAAAEDALDCTQSNNGQPIQFLNGPFASAAPYPSVKFVSGLSGVVSKVTVTLNGIRHFAAENTILVLMGPNGDAVVLLNLNFGGGSTVFTAATNITFDDDAAGFLPHANPVPAGTYKPTTEDSGETDQLPAPAPTQPYGTLLSDFDGIDPNGCWSLWCCHVNFYTVFNPDNAKIVSGWDLTITTV